ncbi:MAG: HD domain-containing phosphohydrolase [Candidatus Omnitrophota bacterium]
MKKSESQHQLNEKISALSKALATVHTVHRLLTSTLDFDELLPRFARLCLQVLRSDYCAILLLDATHSHLIPRAHVDLAHQYRRRRSKLAVGKGVEGWVAKTGNPYFKKNHLCVPLMDEDVFGVISIREKKDEKSFSLYDREILMTLAEQAVMAFKNAKLYEEQEKLTMDSIRALASILEQRTLGRERSPDLLAALTAGISEELHLGREESKMLRYAALLHDAGMITVPERVLTKASKLTGAEYRLIQDVPAKTAEMIRPLRALKPVLPIILHHTERYDGKGYPKGLKGEEIPLGSRILAVAKAFEAMIARRPYRKKAGIRYALTELKRHAGKQFDPHVVQAFLAYTQKKAFHHLTRKF